MNDFLDLFPNRLLIKNLGEPVRISDTIYYGVFEWDSFDGQLGDLSMNYRAPELLMNESEAALLKKGMIVSIRNRDFIIDELFPTGDGVTRITLEENQPNPEKGNWQ